MVEGKNREGSADEERRLKPCWPGFIEYRKKECGEAARYPLSPTKEKPWHHAGAFLCLRLITIGLDRKQLACLFQTVDVH